MDALDTIFYLFCHQLSERSPQFDGNLFPVCSRCAGIYLGIFSAYLALFLFKKSCGMPKTKTEMIFLSFFFLPIMIDGLGNNMGYWRSDDIIRSVTGLSAGIFLASVILPLANLKMINKNYSLNALLYPFITGLIFLILLWFPFNKTIFFLLSLFTAAGLILFVISIFLFCINKNYKNISLNYYD